MNCIDVARSFPNARFRRPHCYVSIAVFIFSLTSLYMSAVFFGKRKAGYILCGSRNWRGPGPEPGVPGLRAVPLPPRCAYRMSIRRNLVYAIAKKTTG